MLDRQPCSLAGGDRQDTGRRARRRAPLWALISTLSACGGGLGHVARAQAPSAAEGAARQRLEEWRKGKVSSYLNDFGELRRYRAANARLPAPISGERRVVFFGDSITDLWRLDQFFPGKPFLNRGIGGQTTSQMTVRFRQDVIDLRPSVVVILAGTNDIAGNTGPMTLEEIEGHLMTMAELARSHGIRVLFGSVLPVHNYTPASAMTFPLRPLETIRALNRWLETYCAQVGAGYIDYFGAMVDAQGWLRRELAEDGLHPNRAGYAIMTKLVDGALAKTLAPVPPTASP